MLDRVKDCIQIFSNAKHSPARYLRWVVSLGILAASSWFVGRKVYSEWGTVSASHINPDIPRLLISWLCITTSTLLGAWEWTLLVKALGGHLNTINGIRIHLISALGKYIPGYVWPYLGKAHLSVRYGVPAEIAIFSIVGELAIVYLSGILILLLSVPFNGLMAETTRSTLIAVGCVVGFIFAAFVFGFLRAQNPRFEKTVNWKGIIFIIFAVTLTWCLLGFGFYMLDISIKPPTGNPLRLLTGLIVALLGGQLAVFVPMGIGVREALLVAILDINKPAWLIVLMAVMLRLEMILGEVVLTLFVLVWSVVKRTDNPKG